jgi:2-methylcitrate dehydratase PrpD
MIKRLHLGRAAEGGATAAMLASRGFEAPHSILEGEFGVLDAFCERSDASLLTSDLGTAFEIEKLCIKRFACHVTAQAPVELLRSLMAEHEFSGADIAELTLTVSDKVLSHHGERRPQDLMLAQYSVPFCVAVAAFRDPADPHAFSLETLRDPQIAGLAGRMQVLPGMPKGWGARLSLRLADGRHLDAKSDSFPGCPERPLSDDDMAAKFAMLTAAADRARMASLLGALRETESIGDCSRL